MKKYLWIILCLLSLGSYNSRAQRMNINPNSNKAVLQKWQDGKLGMFIHWMVCHSPETGDSWSIGRGTPKSVADSISLRWNPVDFNAKEMVDCAVKTGCKYIVVITKHHDGFAIWDSDYGNWNASTVNYQRDILAETAAECRKQGIMFGVYFSIADIHYMGWDKMYGDNEYSPEPQTGMEDFMRYTKGQLKELITRYDPDILWWDGFWQPPVWNTAEGKYIYDYVKSLKPDIIMSRAALTEHRSKSRSFYPFQSDGADGDYFSIEGRTIKDAPFYWETATSITYPTYAYEKNAKMMTKEQMVDIFHRTLCGNGNLLMNIGPTPKGNFDKNQVKRLSVLGDWIRKNERAVYGTELGPFAIGDWGGSTFKGSKLFLHLKNNPKELVFNTLPKEFEVVSAKVLSTGEKVGFENKTQGNKTTVTLHLPEMEKDDITVVELTMNRVVYFTEWLPLTR